LWARARGVDTTDLLQVSAKDGVVFVPGVSFYPHCDVTDGMRLNFSNASPEKIREGVGRLAKAVKEMSS